MKLILLLFLLCLLINNSKCGPDIFKFTSEPVSQNVNPGGSVTLSCVATGRSGITYSWYKLDNVNFNTPPTNSDLISGETNTEYVVQAADVDESGEDRLFQCKATAGSDVILSKVSTVLYKLPDSIEYDNTGKIYINAPIFTSSSDSDKEVFLFSLPCNTLETDYDTSITNGEPYDVQWFKDDETDRVEDSHSNMWTYYTELKSTILYDAVVDANFPVSRSNIKKYDLFIFNVQKSDTGTYSCKAVSRKNKQNVLLGSTVLTVPAQNNQYTIRPKAIAAGFMVLAVDSTGKIRSRPKEGDEVLLMCGVACRTSSGSWDPQYQWKDSSGAVIASTREHIVTVGSAGTVSYTCEILNSECASKLSSAQKTVNMNVGAADLDPLLPFTFSKSPPEYMWYVSDSSKSHDPFEIGCEGSYTSGNTDVVFHNSVLRVPNIVASSGDDVVYDFNSSFTSDKSGVYQCVMFNTPDKVVLYQQTANVIIAENPTSIITPASMNVLDGTTATFTCTVGGYPIESVSISVPDSASVVTCPQTSGNVTCSSTDNTNYEVEVKNMVLSKSGQYTCTVQTKWYKTDGTVMGKQVSASITVTYVKASTTVLTASSTTVKLGEPVTLTCVVEGYPEPATPTLTKYGSQIDWSSACTGTNRKECLKEFSSTKFSDSGEYVCAGSNTIDGTENKSEDKLDLTIEGDVAVTLTQTPAGSEQNKGSSVTLTCKAEGNPLPTKLTFKKGEQVLKSYTGGDDSSIKKGTYHILYEHTISSLVLADTATYKCEGQNTVNGVVKDSSAPPLDLVVISAVEVNLTSTNDTPAKDESITITCTARGGRKPHSVELKKDSTIIKSYPTDSGFCTETDSFTLECTFVTSAGYASGGTYDCIGKNTIANSQVKTVSKSIDIAVSESVKVTMTPASPIEVPIGTDTTVTCTVEGGKKPHKVTLTKPDASVITWLSDGAGSTELSCSGDHVKTCLYKITTVAYSDEGNYQCDGYNTLPGQSSEQKDTAQVSLVPVKDVSVTITKGQVSSFNEVSHGDPFTIGCQADGGRIPFYLKFEHIPTTGQASEIVLYNNPSTTPAEVIVSESENTLSYDYSVSSADYNHDGTYNCLSKNRAASNVEKSDSGSQAITVVKDVEIDPIEDIEADYGTSFTFTITLNGGRSPHLVKLENTGSQIFKWQKDSDVCSGTNVLTCTKVVGNSDVNFGYDGNYTVTAQNTAKDKTVHTDKKIFKVTVYKDVSAAINPSSDSTMTYHVDKTITCYVMGGLAPHKIDLILPNQVTKTWTEDGNGNSLTCTGTHEKTCTYTFAPEYNSDGHYKCVGYNKVRASEEKQKESTVIQLTTVRSTEVTISNKTLSVLTNGTVDVHCTIVGKPLVDSSAVSWSHEKLTDLNLSGNVSTVKGSKDDYTLVSTLSIVNPLTEYSGSFNCNVQAGDDQVITKSVVVSINNREFLDAPKVTHNGGEAVEQDTVMSITCLVKGFPRPSATLIYKNLVDGEQSREISGASKIDPISPTSTEFEFQLSTSCEYSQYNFICEAKNTNNTDSGVLKESSSVEGPIVTGCENTLPVMIGGGVGGGVALIAIVVIAVLCILKRVKSNRNKEYSPKNGTQIPNPAFGADPSYATVRETPGAIGYSHLNRPVGETTEDGYASIDQMNRQTGPGLVPAADAYATLDTASNGRMGLKRQGSDAAYAALNRPAPGKEKRGVIRKYKPIASKPKSTFVPNKAADIELGEVNNGDQPEPTYATVNPATMKAKKTTSEYADVEIPDLPPEVPIYGQGVINKAAPSEYADVTIPPSEYADVTLPPPPPLPDGPVYSNMSETQGAVTDGDPVYAQVDMKSRNAKKNPADEEEEEDLPPDVPIYGTMGARTESNYPDEDEDPYATVEFVPKSKRKPPRPKSKEDTSEGLYATITDFKENSEG